MLVADGCALGVLAIGLFAYHTQTTIQLQEDLAFLTSLTGSMGLAAVALVHLVLPLLLLFLWMIGRRGVREISYQNDMGRVAVSLTAIEEALVRTLENEEGVRKVHIAVRQSAACVRYQSMPR